MTTLRPGSAEDAGFDPARIEHVRGLVEGWVKGGYSPAIALVVARRGVVVLEEAFGVQGPEPGAPPLATDAIFPVLSLTKPVTATVLMSLVEDGLVGLNRPVAEYLPEFTGGGKDDVTLHHLLTHTWGHDTNGILQTLAKVDASAREARSPSAKTHPMIHVVLQAILDTPLLHPPGELMEYSPAGYMLLGEIIERVTGRAFGDLAHERVLEPLGMKDSFLVLPESLEARVVKRPADAPLAGPGPFGPGLNSRAQQLLPNSAGGLYSTARDIAVLCQTFLNGGEHGGARILSPASVDVMTRNQLPPRTRFQFLNRVGTATMGYGWFVESHERWRPMGTLRSSTGFNHIGAGGSIVWIDRERELVGVWFEVLLDMSPVFEPYWNFDLFQNAVTAAVR